MSSSSDLGVVWGPWGNGHGPFVSTLLSLLSHAGLMSLHCILMAFSLSAHFPMFLLSRRFQMSETEVPKNLIFVF